MNIFNLQKPILDKIKLIIDTWVAAKAIFPVPIIEYLDYEPSEGMVDSQEGDAVICVYGQEISFPPGAGSSSGTQNSFSNLVVDAYGFGPPLKDLSDNFEPSIKEAQNRAEILTTLIYRAIMDRTELRLAFGTEIQILDKYPLSIKKYGPIGSVKSKKGICIYRNIYKFETGETVLEGPLGDGYTGSDWSSPTENPPTE